MPSTFFGISTYVATFVEFSTFFERQKRGPIPVLLNIEVSFKLTYISMMKEKFNGNSVFGDVCHKEGIKGAITQNDHISSTKKSPKKDATIRE